MEFRLSQDFYPILTLIFDEIIILRAKNDEFTIGIETLLYDTELLSTASKYVAHKTIKKALGVGRSEGLTYARYSSLTLYLQIPNPESARSRISSGISFRYFRPKLVLPKLASKLATGSTTQSESSGLFAS